MATRLIEMKCDHGPRYTWKNAESIFVPELGLLPLSGAIDYRFCVTYRSEYNGSPVSVEISTGIAKIYISE